MAEITVEACDVCKDPRRDIERWTLVGPEGLNELVLCAEHAKPLRELIRGLRKVPKKAVVKKAQGKKATRARRPSKTMAAVVTTEEIERLKSLGEV